MDCPSCRKEVEPVSYFCIWCSAFLPAPQVGTKAGLMARWFAWFIDPFLMFAAWAAATFVLGAISPDLAAIAAILFPLIYFVWFLVLLRQGLTPGKMVLGLQVVQQQSGAIPGFWRMVLRELIGRFLSGLFLGLGYLWALFDKSGQAWHDKLASTVVVKSRPT